MESKHLMHVRLHSS